MSLPDRKVPVILVSMEKRRNKSLLDGYRFKGFYPSSKLKGKAGDSQARVIVYSRRQKKPPAVVVGVSNEVGTTRRRGNFEIYPAAIDASTWRSWFVESTARLVEA